MITKGRKDKSWLQIRRTDWIRMLAELEARGDGHRESGAFLLGARHRNVRRVTHIVYFDDLEPASLNGAVHLTTSAYSVLWVKCRELGVEVLGDVHTHPGWRIDQSHTDEDNPLVAQVGHFALVVPDYARGQIGVGDVGVYEYRGDDGWRSSRRGLRHRRWF